MVLRDSGLPTEHRLAAEQLDVALRETPKDAICRHALGDCYVKSGNFQPAVEVLEPLVVDDDLSVLNRCQVHAGGQ